MPDQRDFKPQLICDYIKDLNEDHSWLNEWNCILLSKKSKENFTLKFNLTFFLGVTS